MLKVVLDTNALVSARLRPDGTCGELLRLATAGAFEIVLSAPILAELHDVLHRPRIQKRLGADPERIALEYVQAIYAAGRMVTDLLEVDLVADDPDDNHVAAAALARGSGLSRVRRSGSAGAWRGGRYPLRHPGRVSHDPA